MTSVAVSEQTHIARTRRMASALATSLGGDAAATSDIAIVATELATNIVRHSDGGEILLRPWQDAEGSGVELVALDKGAGMANVGACFEDGYSTGGTAGQGLGAVARIAATIDVWSQPGQGTVLAARIPLGAQRNGSALPFVWSAISEPVAGEEECGDGWSVVCDAGRAMFMVVDGLGHGPSAASAARAAKQVFDDRAMRESPAGTMQAIHRGIASTRGGAGAIAEWRVNDTNLVFSGIGNISGTLISGAGLRKMVSHNGTLGHAMRTVREFNYTAAPDATLVLHSDGLTTSWSLENYPGLLSRHPAVIAGILYRDFRRGRDDATVLVAKRKP